MEMLQMGANSKGFQVRTTASKASIITLIRLWYGLNDFDWINTPTTAARQVLLNNAEIQHRIMEELPMLAAFDGFKQARGRRLSDEDVSPSLLSTSQAVCVDCDRLTHTT